MACTLRYGIQATVSTFHPSEGVPERLRTISSMKIVRYVSPTPVAGSTRCRDAQTGKEVSGLFALSVRRPERWPTSTEHRARQLPAEAPGHRLP